MLLHKYSDPVNFRFPEEINQNPIIINNKEYSIDIKDLGTNVFKLSINHKDWQYTSQAVYSEDIFAQEISTFSFELGSNGYWQILQNKKPCLQAHPQYAFGVCGAKWIFSLKKESDMYFYGMGEKNIGMERSGKKVNFWNMDVLWDFHYEQVETQETDPMYVSIPYLLIKRKEVCIGILIDNPYNVFISTPRRDYSRHEEKNDFYFGSRNGQPVIYFIVGDSVATVTRNLQKLCGVTSRPPLWALGHHQCRWGYKSYEDLAFLDEQFDRYQIPCDGLWLDIDYMKGYRVFKIDENNFSEPKDQIAKLLEKKRHIVPILDPGIKFESGYDVYEDGKKRDIYCKTVEGFHYIGYAWPGDTVFPDFSLEEGRKWWAENVTRFLEYGFSGAWLDMNDPSTGHIEYDDMLFQHGQWPHEAFHNQYALGMQKATYDGFQAARPEIRPFIISRSGFISTSRFSAIWTGDNFSNFHHMKKSIEITLNLGLSGIPFNAPDVPGFCKDATKELAEHWYKLGFLFPFLRNHSTHDVKEQEPWAFGPDTADIIKHYISLRYKLLPYLYNLFIEQEEKGDPILRPLFYEFTDDPENRLAEIEDQFMVGPSILQAPFTCPSPNRSVCLPKGRWYHVLDNTWVTGGQDLIIRQSRTGTPIFFRDNSIIPMQVGERINNSNALEHIELHIFVSRQNGKKATYTYQFDDGLTYAYRQGKVSKFTITAEVLEDILEISISNANIEYKHCSLIFCIYSPFTKVMCNYNGKQRTLVLQEKSWYCAGAELSMYQSDEIQI